MRRTDGRMLHCSLELCLRSGERKPWALPSCRFSFLLELEGGWLKVWARLRNWGESESSSGKLCHAEESGEAGGVPGGESPGEKSLSEARLLDLSKLSILPSRPLILFAPLEKIFSKELVKDRFALFFRMSSLNLPPLVEFSGIVLFEIVAGPSPIWTCVFCLASHSCLRCKITSSFSSWSLMGLHFWTRSKMSACSLSDSVERCLCITSLALGG